MVRKAAVAGQFYPFTAEENDALIDSCFERGCGKPGKNKSDKLVAAVCPHAGYIYSGWVAAYSFKAIAEESKATTFVIVSPNHTGLGELVSVYPEGTWETPYGEVKVNADLAKKIVDTDDFAKADEGAHKLEHSVEVQLPFLKYIMKKKEFDIVPITTMLQDLEASISLAKSVFKHKKNVLLIASSDLTHYAPSSTAMSLDLNAIKDINALNSQEFIDKIIKYKMTICGYGPILTALEYAKLCGVKKGVLLKYATSGDAGGDKNSVVGYGSISFRK
jgi:AmmeMemoRadiSam system protein B